jgi:hypothetical protein
LRRPADGPDGGAGGAHEAIPQKAEARAAGPGFDKLRGRKSPAAPVRRGGDQAAGLKIFDALLLIGSAVSAAIFWVNSPSSLACAVSA